MTGVLEICNPNSILNKRIYIKNTDDVIKMDIKRGDKLILKDVGEFEVILFLKGEKFLFLDVREV